MAKLSTAARKKLPAKDFGLPKQRAYPMENKAHAANAESRATQQENRGLLSPEAAAMVRAKAKRVLGK